MPDKFRVNAGFPVNLLLERKDHQHLVHDLAYLIEPSFPPGPDLRADVVNDGYARSLQTFGETQVEIRKVDEQRSVRRGRFYTAGDTPKNAIHRAEVDDGFERSDDGSQTFRSHRL